MTKPTDKTNAATDWDAEAEAPVKVRCIVHTRPHTGNGALAHGEEADVAPAVAKLMLERKQVELV